MVSSSHISVDRTTFWLLSHLIPVLLIVRVSSHRTVDLDGKVQMFKLDG